MNFDQAYHLFVCSATAVEDITAQCMQNEILILRQTVNFCVHIEIQSMKTKRKEYTNGDSSPNNTDSYNACHDPNSPKRC